MGPFPQRPRPRRLLRRVVELSSTALHASPILTLRYLPWLLGRVDTAASATGPSTDSTAARIDAWKLLLGSDTGSAPPLPLPPAASSLLLALMGGMCMESRPTAVKMRMAG